APAGLDVVAAATAQGRIFARGTADGSARADRRRGPVPGQQGARRARRRALAGGPLRRMTRTKSPALAFVTLGCPKNTVDSEHMLGLLVRDGFRTVGDVAQADVAVVNTCAFLGSAVRESRDAIARVAELKRTGRLRGLVVTGCLAQRAGHGLLDD